MAAIVTKKLSKTYRTHIKGEGLKESFRSLIHPEYKEIKAVQDIDITVEEGEILAFIGPNGAGKSTFIKMLCGLLFPSSGEVTVLGMSPSKQRRKLAMRIGTVFGQKSQLWLHLPALDSFTLLAAIYEISEQDRKKRVGELSELFELNEFLTTPVRKLSLGQRIRCEIAASLLHEPELLFLDEPTIGLDVVVKQAIRELITERNREKGTTVFLTSHDPADIEYLCNRAVVIDNGRLVLDTPIEMLKSNYLKKKLIDISFSTPQNVPDLFGVDKKIEDSGLKTSLTVDTALCPVGKVMDNLSSLKEVLDITISNPPMEDIIATIFREQGEAK